MVVPLGLQQVLTEFQFVVVELVLLDKIVKQEQAVTLRITKLQFSLVILVVLHPPLAFLKQHRRQQTLVLQENRGLVSIIKEHHHVHPPQEALYGVDGLKPADHVLHPAL